MRINHNIPALFAHNAYSTTQTGVGKSIQKLSTGLRINSAADDAAGLGISEKMRSQIRGLDQAARNAQDGMSMIQTAEGALQEVHSMLHRMRELSVQASNDILTAQDRSYIQGEIDQLKDAIDRTAETTQFNKKRLLDGSSSVLWSSDNLATEAVIKHGLTSLDQFGQKVTAEGNYKIQITAEPGEAEILKSNIFEIAAEGGDYWLYSKATVEKTITETTQSTLDTTGSFSTGGTCAHITVVGLEGGLETNSSYLISFPNQITQAQARVVSSYNMQANDIELNPDFPPGTLNANMIFEAVEIHDVEKAVTFRVLSKRFDSMGVTLPDIVSFVTISGDGIIGGGAQNGPVQPNTDGTYSIVSFDDLGITLPPDAIRLNKPYDQFAVENTDSNGTVTYGAKFLYSVIAPLPPRASDGHTGIPVQISKTAGTGNGYHYLTYNMSYNLSGAVNGVRFPYMELDRSTGAVSICNIVTNLSSLSTQPFPHSPSDWFTVTGASAVQTNTITIDEEISIAKYIPSDYRERTLAEDKAFYNAAGVCVLDGAQAVTLYMNGSSRDVVLYASDTFSDLQRKFNEAVASLSGAIQYSDGAYFATLADGTEGTSESVYRDEYIFEEPVLLDDDGKPVLDADGNQITFPYQRTGYKSFSTLLVRSVTPGAAGELKFSGDDELLKALGFSSIQESRETEYTVSVYDAHSGKLINSPQKIAGNTIYDAIDGVDVRFDPLAGINVKWNEDTKRFDFTSETGTYTTYVHLSDNTTMLQTGANEGENFMLTLGSVSSSSLGLNGLLLVSQETASRATTVLDNAISKVSAMRAALGSQQNRLEHTIANITTAQTNVTAAESRIRDADMAKEMLNFTRLNILLQSGTAMMTQANQLPQAVLSLLS